MALDGVAVVVLEGVGIDVLPAVHDLAVGGAVPSRSFVDDACNITKIFLTYFNCRKFRNDQ